MDQAVGHGGHDAGGDEHAKDDGGDGSFQPQVQEGCHQGAGPGAGAGQGDGHQQAESQGPVFLHQVALQVGLVLQFGDQPVQPLADLPQPGENAADEHDDEGHGQQISQHGGGQGHRVVQAQGDAVGQTGPQLHHRGHGYEKCGDDLSQRRLGKPGEHAESPKIALSLRL